MGKLLGTFGLLDFATLQLVLDWRAFFNYEPFIYLIFQFCFGLGILNQWIWGHDCRRNFG
jgi:hypothetical protein